MSERIFPTVCKPILIIAGVATAIGMSCGTASAADDDSDASSTNSKPSSESSSSSSNTGSSAAKPDKTAKDDTSEKTSPSEKSDKEDESETDAKADESETVDKDAKPDEDDPAAADPTPEKPAKSETRPSDDAPHVVAKSSKPAVKPAPSAVSNNGSSDHASAPANDDDQVETVTTATETGVTEAQTFARVASAPVATAAVTTAQAPVIVQSVVAPPPTPPSPLDLISMLVTSFFQTLTRGEGAPVPGLTFAETLSVVRREFFGYFIDNAPTAAPHVAMQGAGTVSGTLAHGDADEDFVAFTVTKAPTKGEVEIHGDGTFTYTPNQALAASGGVDTFEVTIDDERRSMFLSDATGVHVNFFGRTGTVTVPVTVNVVAGSHVVVGVGSGPQAIAVHPQDSRAYVANSAGDTISVIDTDTRTEIATIDMPGHPIGLVVSPDGERLYVTNHRANNVAVVDTMTREVIATVSLGEGDTSGAGFELTVSPDGNRVYATNVRDNTLVVIDASQNAVAAVIDVGTDPTSVVASSDGRRVYVANRGDDTVSVIDTATNSVVGTIRVSDGPHALTISPDGSRVYTANTLHHSVSVLDTATSTVVTTIGVGRVPGAIAISPDGRDVYVTHIDDANVTLIDTATNTVVSMIRVGESPSALAVSADGTELYVASFADDTVSVISIVPGRPTVDPASAAANVVATANPTAPTPAPGLAAAAAADDDTSQDPPPPSRPKHTKDFVVTNISQYPLTFQGTESTGSGTYKLPVNGPWKGDVLEPGESVTFYVPYVPAKTDEMFATWTDPTGGQQKIRLAVSSLGQRDVSCTQGGSKCEIDHTADSGNTAYVYFQDAPGTVLNLDGNDPTVNAQRLAELLSDLCAGSTTRTSCSFDPTDSQLVSTPTHQVGNAVVNDDPVNPVTTKITASEQISNTNSLKIGTKLGFKFGPEEIEEINFEISAEYGHTWTKTQTFTQELDVTVPPRHVVYIVGSEPIYRDTGSFTVTSGNTTYNFTNIYFDSPADIDDGAQWRSEPVACPSSGCPVDIPQWHPGVVIGSSSQLAAAARRED